MHTYFPMLLKNLILAGLISLHCLASAELLPRSKQTLIQEAIRYERALGIKQDYKKAYRFYCLAAMQGDQDANYSIGWMYFNGRGVTRNSEIAKGWFERAAKLGSRYGKKMLKRFSKVSAKTDKSCPIYQPGMEISRKHIEVWVRLIAPEFDINPELVLHIIATESAFTNSALSAKNAQGLMQLIPSTAKRFGVTDVWDPVQNITGGVSYLNWLMRYFDGNVQWVLAAYNAGESAVKRYGGIPPYRETQRYVRRIINNYQKPVHPVPAV